MASALDTHHVAVMRVGTELHNGLGGNRRASGAAAVGARVGHNLARTAALGAHHLKHTGTEKRGHVDVHGSLAAARRARSGMLGCNRARAMAMLARLVMAVSHRFAGAFLSLVVIELDLDHDVGAVLGVVRSAGATPMGRETAHAAKRKSAERVVATRIAARVPAAVGLRRRASEGVARAHGVVASALVLIGENSVRLRHLFELLLGIGSFVDVRVKLAGLLLKRLLDLLLRRVLGHAQNGVIVFLVHGCHKIRHPPDSRQR